MANLANRENLFNELFDFRRNFDSMFNRVLSTRPGRERGDWVDETLVPRINAYVDRKDKQFHCEVALPGIDPKNVNIEVQGNVLVIRAEREQRNESRDSDFVYQEISYGSFERDIALPEGVDREKISAEYKNGVLEISAPISTAALPRRIEVKSGPDKQLTATTSR